MKKQLLLLSVPILMASPLINVKASDLYTVKSGDTLWSVSQKTNLSVSQLQILNHLKNNNIFVGQKLTVSPSNSSKLESQSTSVQTYVVKSGDTLYGISSRYNVSISDLTSWNNLKTTTLYVGQKLNLKSSTVTNQQPTTGTQVYAIVAGTSSLNLLTSPNGSVITKIPNGARVQIISTSNGWNQVKYGNYTGWASIHYLNLDKSTTSTPAQSSQPTSATKVYAVVAGSSYLNLRTSPNGTVITTMPEGTQVEILSTSNGWNQVKYGSITGWASVHYLNLVKLTTGTPTTTNTPTQPSQTTPSTTQYAFVNAGSLNLRTSPNGSIITAMPNGSKVQILDSSNGWTKIKFGDTVGWASSQYLTTSSNDNNTTAVSNGKIVVLDPGHGGDDSGATNGSYYEKNLTITLANKTKQDLESMGYKVYLTRTGDSSCLPVYTLTPDLQCRVDKSVTDKADIFVSIHINASLPGAIGTESYYNANNQYDGSENLQPQKSILLAQSIHNRYQPIMGSIDRGVHDCNYYVLRKNTIPATLIEIGFISDFRDLNKMINSTYQDNISMGIAQGINDYFKKAN